MLKISINLLSIIDKPEYGLKNIWSLSTIQCRSAAKLACLYQSIINTLFSLNEGNNYIHPDSAAQLSRLKLDH